MIVRYHETIQWVNTSTCISSITNSVCDPVSKPLSQSASQFLQFVGWLARNQRWDVMIASYLC